jgi:hypothetical protein
LDFVQAELLLPVSLLRTDGGALPEGNIYTFIHSVSHKKCHTDKIGNKITFDSNTD